MMKCGELLYTQSHAHHRIKPGLHDPQLPVERSVTFLYYLVVVTTPLTWSVQLRRSTTIEEGNVKLLSTGRVEVRVNQALTRYRSGAQLQNSP